MFRFGCNQCGHKFDVSEEYVGKWVICKKCNTSVAIPSLKIRSYRSNGNHYDPVEMTMQEDYRFVNVWDVGSVYTEPLQKST